MNICAVKEFRRMPTSPSKWYWLFQNAVNLLAQENKILFHYTACRHMVYQSDHNVVVW